MVFRKINLILSCVFSCIFISGMGVALAFERSNDSSPWTVHKISNDFTQNSYCYVQTNFLKNSDGVYIRSLLIPVDGKAINTRGDFFDLNYRVNLGIMGSVSKGMQSLIDDQPYDFDINMPLAISRMKASSELRIRFQYNSMLGPTTEEHTIDLGNFSEAFIEASSKCGQVSGLDIDGDVKTENTLLFDCEEAFQIMGYHIAIENLCEIDPIISNTFNQAFENTCFNNLSVEQKTMINTEVLEGVYTSINQINRDLDTNIAVFCNRQRSRYSSALEELKGVNLGLNSSP